MRIAEEIFDHWYCASLTVNLCGVFYATELGEGLPTRFLQRHPPVQVVIDMQLQMAFEFVGNLTVAASWPEDAIET
jgi:hypothetical protein